MIDLVIEIRLLACGMCRCVFIEKDNVYFPFGPSSQSVVAAQPDKNYKQNQEKVLCVDVVKQTRCAIALVKMIGKMNRSSVISVCLFHDLASMKITTYKDRGQEKSRSSESLNVKKALHPNF